MQIAVSSNSMSALSCTLMPYQRLALTTRCLFTAVY